MTQSGKKSQDNSKIFNENSPQKFEMQDGQEEENQIIEKNDGAN